MRKLLTYLEREVDWSEVNLRYERWYHRMIRLTTCVFLAYLFVPAIEEEVTMPLLGGAAAIALFFGMLSYGPAVRAWFKRVPLRRRGYPY